METLPALSHEVWERTPSEAQAYIRALEARVETLASMVHAFQEQVRTLQGAAEPDLTELLPSAVERSTLSRTSTSASE